MNLNTFLGLTGLLPYPSAFAPLEVTPTTPAAGDRYTMPSFYPTNDAQFSVWLGNFIAVANANLTALGMTTADITALTALKTDLDAKVAAAQTAQEAAVAATAARKVARKAVNDSVGPKGRIIGENPAISNALKEELGLRVRDTTPTPIIPVPPTDLAAQGLANGVNVLKWKSGGNKPGTLYIIEARIGAAAAFTMIDTVTSTRYEHKNQTPGVRVFYRIKAKRASSESNYSTEAVVYSAV